MFIDTPLVRGHLDNQGRRIGIWIARIAEGWLVELYVAGVAVGRDVVASSPS